jgi:hypothetical integral membrane protein (TIGR02206 family)
MRLFGPLHVSILAAIAAIAALLAWLCRRSILSAKRMRWALGMALAANELAWWVYRYSKEGMHMGNLPLQLCDAAVWLSVLACLNPAPVVVEFAYFAGLAGAGMALLTPNLTSPWPTYPAIYFFAAHGGIVICVVVLVFGSARRFRISAVWRSFGLLLIYAALVGLVDRTSGSNYMFLLRKPDAASPVDQMGPWPWYLFGGAAAGLGIVWLLWLPVRPNALNPPPEHVKKIVWATNEHK